MGAATLNKAAAKKDDEFYTPLAAIENEIPHYGELLKGKRILCNCRDLDSAFRQYDWFKHGVREVVFVGTDKYVVAAPYGQTSYEVPYPANSVPASYDDAVGKALLNDCDIAITNPPFSSIRRFIKTIVERKKDFVIVAPLTAIGNKYVGNLLVEGKLRVGYTPISQAFTMPDGSTQKFGNCVWFTSLPVKRASWKPSNNRTLDSYAYPRYDTVSDVLFVDRCRNIPIDYKGIMAVPLSFLCHHNEDDYELVDGRILHNSDYAIWGGYEHTINGKHKFTRVLIRRRQ